MRSGGALAVALLLGAALGVSRGHAADPKPEHAAVDDRTQACATCHAEIAREWGTSAHRSSGTDPAYVAAVTKEPLPFCRACHVPSVDPARPTPASLAERGVGCVDCHTGLAADHARRARAPRPARSCAGCHEFGFPRGPGLMQRTVTEHASSAFAGSPCESCHMPSAGAGRPHKDHRFAVDAAMLREALVASITRAGPTRVAVRLAPGRVGHAVPTGDLFRRLEVRAEAAEGQVEKRRYLSRKFRTEMIGGVAARVDAEDDRVGAGLAPCFEMDLGPRATGLPIAVGVHYEKVQEPRTAEERGAIVHAATPLLRVVLAADEAPIPCGLSLLAK